MEKEIVKKLVGNIKGADAKITEVTASVDESTGTPAVSVEMGGTESERSFHFSFSGLKGKAGEEKVTTIDVNKLTPTYTESESLTTIESGEALSTAFGKIKKAISSLISHIADTTKHITSAERTAWNNKASASHTHTASEVVGGTSIIHGTYTGDGNSQRLINLGERPRAVLLMTNNGLTFSANNVIYGGLATRDTPCITTGSGSEEKVIEIVDNGFNVFKTNYSTSNYSGMVYNYVAFL